MTHAMFRKMSSNPSKCGPTLLTFHLGTQRKYSTVPNKRGGPKSRGVGFEISGGGVKWKNNI